jgi:hypothetical protein
MIATAVLLAIVAYIFSVPIMAKMPRFGYMLSWPLRLALPAGCYANIPSLEGLLLGVGLSVFMSFEYQYNVRVGVAILIAAELCRTTV